MPTIALWPHRPSGVPIGKSLKARAAHRAGRVIAPEGSPGGDARETKDPLAAKWVVEEGFIETPTELGQKLFECQGVSHQR